MYYIQMMIKHLAILIALVAANSGTHPKTSLEEMKLRGKVKLLRESEHAAEEQNGTWKYRNELTERSSIIEFRFDESGYETEEITYDRDGRFAGRSQFIYTPQKVNTGFNFYDKENKLAYPVKYVYDKDGRKIEEDECASGPEAGLMRHVYSKDGLLANSVWYSCSGKPTTTYEYGYDDKGNQTYKKVKFEDGRVLETFYTYDSNGLLIEKSYREPAEPTKYQYEFDSTGNWIARYNLDAYGGGTATVREITYY